jgi:hypothetical protein
MYNTTRTLMAVKLLTLIATIKRYVFLRISWYQKNSCFVRFMLVTGFAWW